LIKNYIIDTNVMIHDPEFMYKFEDNNIIIPILCIQELDNLKNKEGIVGYQARSAARELNNIRNIGNLHKGIKLHNGGTLCIELNHTDTTCLPDGLDVSFNDTKILAVTKNLQDLNKDIPTILVTKDLYLAIKGDALGIITQDYENDKITTDELYKGYVEISLPTSEMDKIYNGGILLPDQLGFQVYPNEFLHIKSSTDKNHEVLARYDGEKMVPLKFSNELAWGLSPLNMEQKMAFELLMDDNISFVSITGGAGSGKTILSTAVALQKVIEQGLYRKIIFVRPVVPAGDDIGFLPGSENEKLRPWMGSFYDAIENLMDMKHRLKSKNGKKVKKNLKAKKDESINTKKVDLPLDEFIEGFRLAGTIETKTFTYMRGRTLTNALVIVDEAQQTTPHLAKLMLTRAGFGSKFVFLGDPTDNQIDNILVDAKSNGLVYAVEKMKEFNITGHVTLQQVERSAIAKLAEKCM
jgi:PhoH-like ATPase